MLTNLLARLACQCRIRNIETKLRTIGLFNHFRNISKQHMVETFRNEQLANLTPKKCLNLINFRTGRWTGWNRMLHIWNWMLHTWNWMFRKSNFRTKHSKPWKTIRNNIIPKTNRFESFRKQYPFKRVRSQATIRNKSLYGFFIETLASLRKVKYPASQKPLKVKTPT